MSLEGVDDVHGYNGLPLGVLGVGYSIPDHALQVVFEHSSGLIVDQSTDTLDTSSSCKTSDGWLGDALDVIS